MSLPMEVIADILSRLPVEPLLRFRCVCPPWRDLIDSKHFAKLHLNRSVETETNLTLIFNKPGLQIANFRPLDRSVQVTDLDHHPLKSNESNIQVWGSCNGLLCLANDSNTVVIWNPSTRKHVKLPEAKFETLDKSTYHRRRSCGYGFGYDKIGDDYKVVMVVDLVKKRDYGLVVDYEAQVYSNKSDSWRWVEKFHFLPCLRGEPGKLAAGVLHWTMSLEPEKAGLIVGFDLGIEKFRIIRGPKLEDLDRCLTTLDSFQETISLVADYFLGYLDVWVMKDYGVEKSWTKLFQFVDLCSRPIYCPKNSGEVLMQHNLGLLWFDSKNSKHWHETVNDKENKNMKHIEMCGVKKFMRAEICMESLVSIRGSRRVTDQKKRKANKKNDMGGFLSKGFKLVL